MKYFKNLKNEVYAYSADGSQDTYIKSDLIPITEAEKDTLLAPTAAEITAAENAAALAELELIDKQSIRAIREYIASKADAPQILKDREGAAQAERAKIK